MGRREDPRTDASVRKPIQVEPYRFRSSVTFDPPLSIVAVSPRRDVTVPSRRTVDVEGWAEGEKAWRCLGRMRGVAWDIVGDANPRRSWEGVVGDVGEI